MEITELLKKVRKIEIKSKKIVNTLFLGEYHSVFKGKGIEFSEVREYQYGDDIRLIDWNVTARMEKPFIKVNHEERELTLYLILDLSLSMFWGSKNQLKRDLLAELAAIFAFSAISNNDKVGLIIFSNKVNKYIKAAKGKKQALLIIREILNFNPDKENSSSNIEQALIFYNKIQKKKAIAILFTDFYASKFSDALRYTSRKHQFIPVWLKDPLEKDLPKLPFLNLIDSENKNKLLLTRELFNNSNVYNNSLQERENQIEQIFKECKTTPLILSTNEPYLKKLLTYFKK